MFTIEHDFDATVITLMDEAPAPPRASPPERGPALQEDVTVNAFEDCVTVEQYDPREDRLVRITLSMAQLRDLGAALNLPEGMYRLRPTPPDAPPR